MLSREDVVAEEESLRREVTRLSDENRRAFYQKFERQVRDPDTYAVLNFLFITGLHHFYIGRWLRGMINLSAFVLAIFLMFQGNIWLGLGILLIVSLSELYALFRSQTIILDYNNRLIRSLLDELA